MLLHCHILSSRFWVPGVFAALFCVSASTGISRHRALHVLKTWDARVPDCHAAGVSQAAALAGGGLLVRGNLLRELLTSSGAFGLLLGGGGPGGEAGACFGLQVHMFEYLTVPHAILFICA